MSQRTRLICLGGPAAAAVLALVLGLAAAPLHAQLPATALTAVFPPGGNPGKTVEVTLSGANLDDVHALSFSHPGITAAQKMAEPGPFDPGPQPVAGQFVVTIKADVPRGLHEVRALGKYGLSNPRAFIVDQLPELVETEPNSTADEAIEIQPPLVVFGRANQAADVDCYRVSLKRGQRLLVECFARRIDSRMDPAVVICDSVGIELETSRDEPRKDALVDFTAPADGAYVVQVFDSLYRNGDEYFYRLSIGPLPHIDFIFPPAGVAGTSTQFTLFGRNLPGGQAAGLTIDGKPLEKQVVSIQLPPADKMIHFASSALLEPEQAGLDGLEYRVQNSAGPSNAVLISSATAPPTMEAEPNNTADKAQKLAIPCEVQGQFYPMRDDDWFAFEAKKDDIYEIEVFSQRLGVPTDPRLLVQQVSLIEPDKSDESGEPAEEQVRVVATADDAGVADAGGDFDARNDDPVFRFVAPADGLYRVLVNDAYSAARSDPRHVYRLSIRTESPDFRLAAVPTSSTSALLLRKGGQERIRVVAYRRDGFDGPIALSVTGLPQGVTCAGAVIGPARDSAVLVLSAADGAPPGTARIEVVGKAQLGSGEVARGARCGSAIWYNAPQQNNQPPQAGLARVTRDLALSVSAGEVAPATIAAGEAKTWETSRAGILKIPYSVTRRGDFKNKLDVTPVDLPANIDAPKFAVNPDQTSGQFELKLKPNTPLGTYTFYLLGTAPVKYSRNPEAAQAAEEEKKRLEKVAADAAAAAKTAGEAKAAADKTAAETTAALEKATATKTAADKAAQDAAAALKAAMEKEVQAKAAAAAKAGDKALAEAATAAQKATAVAATANKAAADAAIAAQKALEDAQAKAKAAAEAKAAADKVAEETAARSKLAAAAKAAADKRAADTANAAKPKDINVAFVSTPITLKVTPAPITLAATPPAQPIKQGEKLEVAVSITRLYNYADPVALSGTPPQGVAGLQVANANIDKGQAQGKVVVTTAANTPPGTYDIVIRAVAKLNNQNLTVEQTIPLTIQPAPPAEEKK